MHNTFRRGYTSCLCLLLVLVSIFTWLPVTAFAASLSPSLSNNSLALCGDTTYSSYIGITASGSVSSGVTSIVGVEYGVGSTTAPTVTVAEGTVTMNCYSGKAINTRYNRAGNATMTVTFTNNYTETLNVSFDLKCTVTGGSGSGCSTTDNKTSYALARGESFSVTVNSNYQTSDGTDTSVYTTTVTMSNVKVEKPADKSAITFAPAACPYTVSDGSESLSINTESATGSYAAGTKLTFSFTSEDYALAGIVVNGQYQDDTTTFTVSTTNDTVYPLLMPKGYTDDPFLVNEKYYDTWDLAFAAAGTAYPVILAKDYTLPKGEYTIPSGGTLLIPYDDANTLCTTSPTVNDSSIVAPTAYRTLTMAEGASIIVNGGLSVSGSQTAAYPANGNVTGPVGVIKMNDESNITVNNGGSLYAWGYVAGSGTVTIESGGCVYEDFQVRDYRGGEVTTTLAKSSGSNVKTWHIFPMSQYYVQNVQVPMTLKAGASEFCCFSVTASLMGIKSENVNFIGEDSMFQITSGYIIKDYIESTDRLSIDVYGNLEVNPFSIEIQVQGLSSAITINSANYDLPLNSNITINLKDSSTVDLNQDLLMLPGSEINIDANATLNVNSGKRLIVYDSEQWGLYCSDLKKAVVPLAYVFNGTKGAAPAYTRTTADLVDAKILVDGKLDAEDGYLYTTEGGGNICSSGNGQVLVQQTPEATAYQIEQKRNGDDDFNSSTELDAHTITSAQLKNADDSYVETASATSSTTYHYAHGVWHETDTAPVVTQVAAQNATCTADGWDAYEYCDSCDYTTYNAIPATGHTEVIDAAVEATCTATGLTAGSHCSVCSTVIVAQEVVAALGHTEVTDAAVAATCTTAGKTEGSHCSVCNEVLVAQETVAATGHKYGDGVVTTPTCTERGYTKYTCGSCSHSYYVYVNANGHSYTNGTCTVCGVNESDLFNIYGSSITVGDGLDIYFYVKVRDGMDYTGWYAKIVKTYADGREDSEKKVEFSEWVAYDTNIYRFSFSDISAKEMTDEIYVTIYDSNGKAVSETRTESVQGYALRVLARICSVESAGESVGESEKKLRTALVDMLNYGAGCQDFFSYNTEDLATSEADAYQKFATVTVEEMPSPSDNDTYFKAASVSAENKLTLTLYFDSEYINKDMTADINYNHRYGGGVSTTVNGSSFVARTTSNGISCLGVDIAGLAITDGWQSVTCTIKNGDTEIVTISYSVAQYVADNNPDDSSVYIMLLKFIDSACAYFDYGQTGETQ